MKYVFLDFDGVLNSWDFFEREKPFDQFRGVKEVDHFKHSLASIDPKSVEILNRLVRPTVGFVVSSTWRLMHPLHHLQSMLSHLGFKGLLLGCTPSMTCRRGGEIDTYLGFVEFEDFVIIDDDSDMEPHEDKLVQTKMQTGITDDNVTEILGMFGMNN